MKSYVVLEKRSAVGRGGKRWRGNEDGEGSRSEPDRVSQCLAREGERPVTGK